MKQLFSETQNRVVHKIWIFGVVLFSLSMLLYCIDVFTPNTNFFKQFFRTLNWFFNTLIIAWYFYKNDKTKVGVIFQLISIPYFFGSNISFFLDYNFTSYFYDYTWYKSDYISKIVRFITFMLPLLYFVKHYIKLENANLSKKLKWIPCFLISLILMNVIDVNVDDLFKYFGFLNFSEPYYQDILVTIIQVICTFKILFILVGFFYITNRLDQISSLRKPIAEKYIDNNFFKWGFIISFSILLLTLLNLGQSIFSISIYSREFELAAVSKLLSNYFLVFYSGRFLGNLVQYRGYSLKKYFGIINVFTLAPLLNIIPFLVLLLSKKRDDASQYLNNMNKNKNIHLAVYCFLISGFLVYDYFDKEVKDTKDLIKIPVYLLAIFLVTRFKIMTKIVPFVVVLFLYFEDIKAFFDFTEGYLSFFKEKIFSFLWLSSFALFLVYYVLYYVLHKSFYVDYSNAKSQEKLSANIEKFNQSN
jgi:hypothetical protein